MKAIRRFVDFFWDSPTYGRDRANFLTGFTIGTAALLLNGVVLLFMLPLVMNPDEPTFQRLTDNVGFGQLLALILLGGATALASLLIPLRLATVFFEPRNGRYFDQVVLSGITPLRFMIGKATSQNLFLALIGFLLLPYLVLSLTLGGIDLSFFAAGLFLVWLYCLMIALVALWLSLYMNELMGAVLIIVMAAFINGWGCIPMRNSPFVISPFPTLLHPIYSSIPQVEDIVPRHFAPLFINNVIGMSAMICACLFAIFLGPLYGIIRENSMFGEVVRAGDSKRKRWIRIRVHIQRSSELAFFYRNRTDALLRFEGLIRWGIAFGALVLSTFAAHVTHDVLTTRNLSWLTQAPQGVIAAQYHAVDQVILGVGLFLAVLLFSHAKNTTYVKLPFVFGWKVEVSKLDTAAFLMYLIFSTAYAIYAPYHFEKFSAVPEGVTVFPSTVNFGFHNVTRTVDFAKIGLQVTGVLTLAGVTVYCFQRAACLGSWMRASSGGVVGFLYGALICTVPYVTGTIILETRDLNQIPALNEWAPVIAAVSPGPVLAIIYNGEMHTPFPEEMSTVPFYVSHAVFIICALLRIQFAGRKLRQQYLLEPAKESAGV